MTLTNRELATVLAGLRALQQVHDACAGDIPNDLLDVATNGDEFKRLDLEEIDQLCERLNSESTEYSAAELLVIAYSKGAAAGGSTEWSDLDLAHDQAVEELPAERVTELRLACGCDEHGEAIEEEEEEG